MEPIYNIGKAEKRVTELIALRGRVAETISQVLRDPDTKITVHTTGACMFMLPANREMLLAVLREYERQLLAEQESLTPVIRMANAELQRVMASRAA